MRPALPRPAVARLQTLGEEIASAVSRGLGALLATLAAGAIGIEVPALEASHVVLAPPTRGVETLIALSVLVAALDMNRAIPMDCLAYKFDIVLRGRRQTLFENKLEGM